MSAMKHDQRGMTLVETMAACVILTILMTILIQGVLAASDWFAESSRIKDNGETVANSMEGQENSKVSASSKAKGYELNGSDGALKLPGDNNTETTYSYSDTSFITISTEVADYVATGADSVYDPTSEDAAEIAKTIQDIVDQINAGTFKGQKPQNNQKWQNEIRKNLEDGWPTLSDAFKKKYHLDASGGIMNSLSIRAYLVGSTASSVDFIYYVCNDTGVARTDRPFLIYDPAARVWLRCPKKGKGDNFNDYVSFDLSTNQISSVGNYSYFEEDGYIYLHEDPVESVESRSISYSSSTELLNFIRTEGNGWEVLWPAE